jgi:hypothetical protein
MNLLPHKTARTAARAARWLAIFFAASLAAPLAAQSTAGTAKTAAAQPFKGHFVCKEHGVHLHLNLYEADLTAPGFSFLGKLNGYMDGNIYGTWMLTRHEVKDGKARLRFANDIGSDTQDAELTLTSDSTFHYRAIGGNAVRRAVGRKLVKTEGSMDFILTRR